jgi:hypothetical protein
MEAEHKRSNMPETRIDYRSLMDFRGRPAPQATKGRAVQPGELEDDPDVVYNTFSPTGGFKQVFGKRPKKAEPMKFVARVPEDQMRAIVADPQHRERVRDPLTNEWRITDPPKPKEVEQLEQRTKVAYRFDASGYWLPTRLPVMSPEMVRTIEHTGMKEGDPGYPQLIVGSHNQLTYVWGKNPQPVRDPTADGSSNIKPTRNGYVLRLPLTPPPDPRLATDVLAPGGGNAFHGRGE